MGFVRIYIAELRRILEEIIGDVRLYGAASINWQLAWGGVVVVVPD